MEHIKVFSDFWTGAKYADNFIQNINVHLKHMPDYHKHETYKDGNLSIGLYRETA